VAEDKSGGVYMAGFLSKLFGKGGSTKKYEDILRIESIPVSFPEMLD
jgi:hypothetical protein